ncbi:MAG: L-2-amino-thiazoline-4-carboxylic acid hydrolase [Anaerolineaceae bacterium]|nr:L-2-amino-thiazoline-4-carboxylic acid hydrolase [Anaerolineaceae bacterium]
MSDIPCRQRTFPSKINITTYYPHLLRWLKHLIERIGTQNALLVWEIAFQNYDDMLITNILSSGWKQVESNSSKSEDIILKIIHEFFDQKLPDLTWNEIRDIIDNTPPIYQIKHLLSDTTWEKEISAYDALLLLFDGQACLAEATIDKFGKQGELIVYDLMRESRLAAGQGQTGSIEEFIEGFTSPPLGRNLYSAASKFDVVHKTDTEAIVYMKECEWARYFRDYHPDVGYMIACSTDEVAFRAFNSNLRMQRTETLMEGADKCDFRVYSSQDNNL